VKVVLDTNVLLSGLIVPESGPGRIIRAWREARLDLVVSEAMLDEIRRILAYPKIRKRLRWDRDAIERFILLLRFRCTVVVPPVKTFDRLRDPADAMVLATLVHSEAEALITGDSDLLALADDYPVISPAEFVRRL
jgi:putative PIN family toxin of toxin-antitoxin system